MMFTSPPELTLEWSDEGAEGAYRFLKRLWRAVYQHVDRGAVPPVFAAGRSRLAAGDASPTGADSTGPSPHDFSAAQKDLRRLAHQTLAKVGDDIGRRRTFNTAIAAVMELLNAISRHDDASPAGRAVVQEALEIVVLTLSPVVPHVTHALWRELGHERALIDEPWPASDSAALVQDTLTYAVQVNGKLRATIAVAADADEAAIREAALADENVRKFVADKPVKKVIVVPRKLVSVVV
jgi:leucyl-tRNA synthetase